MIEKENNTSKICAEENSENKSARKSATAILKEIRCDEGYKKLSEGNEPVYYLVDTQDENKVYLFSTQKQIEEFTDNKGVGVKQSNISTHKDTGTLSRNRWLIFSKKCVSGKKILRFKWKPKKSSKAEIWND